MGKQKKEVIQQESDYLHSIMLQQLGLTKDQGEALKADDKQKKISSKDKKQKASKKVNQEEETVYNDTQEDAS